MLFFDHHLCFLLVESIRDVKTPRDGYHAYHGYQRSRMHVRLGGDAHIGRGDSSSWQTTGPMMATMVTTSTK